MRSTKYISLEKLKKRFKDIIDRVLKDNIEYVVMVNREAKFRISPISNEEGKRAFIVKQKSDDKLEKFIS